MLSVSAWQQRNQRGTLNRPIRREQLRGLASYVVIRVEDGGQQGKGWPSACHGPLITCCHWIEQSGKRMRYLIRKLGVRFFASQAKQAMRMTKHEIRKGPSSSSYAGSSVAMLWGQFVILYVY